MEVANLIDTRLKITDKKYELKDTEYLEDLNAFIPYFFNLLWENPKVVSEILIYSNITDVKNNLASFFMNNFYDNILSEDYIEDNLLIVLTLLMKKEINNLENSQSELNFLSNYSPLRFLLKELRKRNDVKNFFKTILIDIVENLESKHADTHIIFEMNEMINEVRLENEKPKHLNKGNKSYYNNLNFVNLERSKSEVVIIDNYIVPENPFENNKFVAKYLPDFKKSNLEEKLNDYKNNPNIAEYLQYQIDACQYNEKIFSNKYFFGSFANYKYASNILSLYENNFMIVIEIIDKILDLLMKNLDLFPYSLKCLCKIISILITKKFPSISTIEKNIFIGKFFFATILSTILKNISLEALITDIIISKNTVHNIYIISTIIDQFASGSFFTNKSYFPFNSYFLEKIPILYKLFEKLTDVTISPLLEKAINDELDENYKYNYFVENKDEPILHKCVCYNLDILSILIKTINKNKKEILTNRKQLEKTLSKLNNESSLELIEKLKEHEDYEIVKELKPNTKKPEYVFNKKRKKLYFFLYSDFVYNDNYKKLFSIKQNAISYDNKKTNKEPSKEEILNDNLIKVKRFLSYLLSNYRKIKNVDFINEKILTTENLLTELKKSMNSSNFFNDDTIPSNWYIDALLKYINKIPSLYIENDFEKLYLELENDINKSMNELDFGILSIYNDKIKCIQLHKNFCKSVKKSILDFQLNEKVKQIIENEIIPVEIKFEFTAKEKSFSIVKAKINKNKFLNNKQYEENISNSKICPTIESFQRIFPNIKEFEMKNVHPFDMIRDLKIPEQLYEYFLNIKNYLPQILNLNSNEISPISNKIYDYIMNRLYKKLFPTMPLKQDLDIFQTCVLLSWIEPKHFINGKVNYVYDAFLADILKFVQQLEIEKSPRKKIINLSKIFSSIINLEKFNGGKGFQGVDDNLPILNYAIIKSKPFQLYSNTKYIELFSGHKCNQLEGNQLYQLLSICEICQKITYKELNNISEEEFERKCSESRMALNENVV